MPENWQTEFADTRLHVCNSIKADGKMVAAAEPVDTPDSDGCGSSELSSNTVAAVPPGKSSSMPGKPRGGKHAAWPNKQLPSNSQPFICFNHFPWSKEAWECTNPKHCRFEGNGKAGEH